MKKLLISLLLCLAASVAFAQSHLPQDILAVSALNIGTNGAGGGGWTNLSLLTTNAGMVYNTNIVYTNASGVQIRANGATNSFSTAKLFNNVVLFTDRNGQPINNVFDGAIPGTLTNQVINSSQTLVIEIINNQGSNGPIGLVFAPNWDDTVVTSGRANDWAVVIGGNTSSKYTITTNVPTWRWPGAKSFTLRYQTNQFDHAGIGALTNGTFISAMKVVGFRP